MTEREKVIKGIEHCVNPCTCSGCPYIGKGECVRLLMEDAHELLKEQEPRVLTLIEWIRAPEPVDGECMCYEIKDKGLQAMLVKAFDGARHLYGKAFRCWTSRPSDEVREAVPWQD